MSSSDQSLLKIILGQDLYSSCLLRSFYNQTKKVVSGQVELSLVEQGRIVIGEDNSLVLKEGKERKVKLSKEWREVKKMGLEWVGVLRSK